MTNDNFCQLIEQSLPHLRAYARSLCRNADAADDLVQDTLIRAWSAREQFAEGTNFKAWTFTILRNRFLDQRRRDRDVVERLEDYVDERLTTKPVQENILHFDDVARAYWKLTPHHREILMLVGANGLSYEEAAEVIGCAVGTVRSRLSRARVELQTVLEQSPVAQSRAARKAEKGAPAFLRAIDASAEKLGLRGRHISLASPRH